MAFASKSGSVLILFLLSQLVNSVPHDIEIKRCVPNDRDYAVVSLSPVIKAVGVTIMTVTPTAWIKGPKTNDCIAPVFKYIFCV